MKYFLIAGERSGDLHGSNLMKSLQKIDPEAEFKFFGGDYMKAIGGEPVVHYAKLAFMGFWEVLKNLGKIRHIKNTCQKTISAYQPDTIILIDYAGFNLRIAKWAKSRGFKVFYYISPKLWAWNQRRVKKVKRYVDHMFVIMPFEVEFYRKHGYMDVSYVGNPVVDSLQSFTPNPNFLVDHNINIDKTLVGVLPGSRGQELAHILPTLADTMRANPDILFLVAGVDNLPEEAYSSIIEIKNCMLIIDDTYNILANSRAAIVTSGTATLETAVSGVPQVVVYKGGQISYSIARMLVTIKFISLVNLMLNRECVKELIQKDCSAENISNELASILASPNDYTELIEIIGGANASDNTANGIFYQL